MNKKSVLSIVFACFACTAGASATSSGLGSAKALAAQNLIKKHIQDKKKKNPDQNPTLKLILPAEAISNFINELLAIDKLQAKAQSLMPIVQQKAKNAGDKKDELEKDKDVQEFISLSQEINRLYKAREEIMKNATDKFSGIIFSMDKDAIVFPLVSDPMVNPLSSKANHVYFSVKDLFEECLRQAYVEYTNNSANNNNNNAKNAPKASANTNNPGKKNDAQPKSTVEAQMTSGVNK